MGSSLPLPRQAVSRQSQAETSPRKCGSGTRIPDHRHEQCPSLTERLRWKKVFLLRLWTIAFDGGILMA